MGKLISFLIFIIAFIYYWNISNDYKTRANNANTYYQTGSYEKALEEFKYLASMGDTNVYLNLGIMYQKGQGTDINYSEAFKWYEKGKEAGDIKAKYALATMYIEGEGIEINYDLGKKLLSELSEENFPEAQYSLGYMYQHGLGFEADKITAYGWYGVSAANGVEIAAKAREALEVQLDEEQLLEARDYARTLWDKYKK